LLGDVHPDGFEAATAQAHYRQALALAEELGLRALLAHCHLSLGKLYDRMDSANRSGRTSPLPRRCTARWA
jgi:hypothetical protein